ncbi:MAG: hypothetical protein CL843_09415 [Crocinitomicaceae bacterium]|nr:hypothetical protein [Crocinitomicaceae bacterium]|tara:strand:+ start:6334 stop:6777 length:444 start_codon:yes stop_codon:yes gene_type:complete
MTGSIHNASVTVFQDQKHDALQLGFTNDSGGDLVKGQEVYLKSAGGVDKRTDGSTIPLGVVIVGAEDGEKVTVRTFFTVSVTGVAKTNALNYGVAVVPNGTVDSSGRPEYVAAGASVNYCAITIKGGAADSEILVGILDSFHTTPSA